ncbi:MAG: endo-1,4-beta-xylanase [Gammaproteobacteria bacterium]|nr:endo-1,4-beta-xylanase [Gammaproteobacteria bacterium]
MLPLTLNKARRVVVCTGMAFALLGLAACSDGPDAQSLGPVGLNGAARQAGLQVGVALNVSAVAETASEQRRSAVREFTSVTAENAMKWASLAPAPGRYEFGPADQLVNAALANGQRVRGHTLFWHRLNGLPGWLEAELGQASDRAGRLRELMANHIDTVVGRYAGQVAQWDVINEPLSIVGADLDTDNVFSQLLGEQYIDLALLHAHAADPSAELYINETFTEFVPTKFDALLALAQRVLDRGAPLHGLGLQGHFFFQPPDAGLLQEQLQRIAAMGLKVEITELDIPLPLFNAEPDPLAAQAGAYADVFNACLAVPLCSGITVWGLDDANTWLDSFELTQASAPNRPLLFDDQLRAKPAYDSVVAALLGVMR